MKHTSLAFHEAQTLQAPHHCTAGQPVALRAAALGSEEEAGAGDEAPDETCPARHENYAEWLAAKKRAWRQGVEARKKRRLGGEPGQRRGGREAQAQGLEAGSGALAGMLRQQATSAASLHWQIVGIDHTEQPGVLRRPSAGRAGVPGMPPLRYRSGVHGTRPV